MTSARRAWWLAVAGLATSASILTGQTGSLAGKITDAQATAPLSGARVAVLNTALRQIAGGSSGADGSYRVADITPGTYTVVVSVIGYASQRVPDVKITAGGTARLDAALSARAYEINELVVSASRTPEKIVEAPASVFAVSQTEIQERPAMTVADHLKGIPGVDVSQGGILQSNVVARGFNNAFSGTLLTLIDNRYASVPSLRVNVPAFFPTTNDDIERVELVLGPAAALYGPNAANGVLHIITKSPFTSAGTTISVEGGLRGTTPGALAGTDNAAGIGRFSFRHASVLSDKVAFKISGEYLKGRDWRYADKADTVSPGPTATTRTFCGTTQHPYGCRDFALEKWNGEARIDVRPDRNTEWITTYGRTTAGSLIELTGIGAGQAKDWTYQSVQTRFRHKAFFAQGFVNTSDAGGTFILRSGNPIVDKSRLWTFSAQHGFDFGTKETILYGLDYIFTDARTEGTINGVNEADDGIKEIGGYVHSVTRLSPKFDVVSALRLDKNSRLASAVLSPRVGLVFKVAPDQNLRFTYNRSFSTPSNNNLFLDIVASAASASNPYNVRALGVPENGFHFRVNGGCTGGVGNLCMRSPFAPQAGLLPANAAALWQVAIGFLLQSPNVPAALKPLLQSIPAPTTQVGTVLRALNPTTAAFDVVTADQVRDIDRLKPTISNGVEAGYKAIFNSKVKLSIDAWYEHKTNFVGPLIVESPNVFLDPATLGAYLASKGVPAQALPGLVAGAAGIPLGTVVPNDGGKLTQRPDIFLTYRNFGTVKIFGSDLALDYIASDRFSVSGTYSWVNKDFFPRSEVGGLTDVALNAAKSKGSATLRFRNDRQGWGSELRFRAVAGFPVNSGVYVGHTDGYGVVDLGGTYRPPVGGRNMLFALNVTNVFNHGYATFVGVPRLGRLVLTKISYTF